MLCVFRNWTKFGDGKTLLMGYILVETDEDSEPGCWF